MKEELIDAIGNIDDDIIESVDSVRKSNKKVIPVWIKYSAAVFCIIAGAVAVLLLNRTPETGIPETPEKSSGSITENQSKEITDKANIEDEAAGTKEEYDGFCETEEELYYTEWESKTVSARLVSKLNNGDGTVVYDIAANPYIDYEFVFNGRTLGEYYADSCYERNLPEILYELLKDGDSLKYGAALYEGTAPSGEKWDKALYEERVAFYGEELLKKYIVNGEFLADKVKADIEPAKNAKEATIAYKEAFRAYYKHLVDTLQLRIPANTKGDSLRIVLHMTAEEFKSFNPPNVSGWTFYDVNEDKQLQNTEK